MCNSNNCEHSERYKTDTALQETLDSAIPFRHKIDTMDHRESLRNESHAPRHYCVVPNSAAIPLLELVLEAYWYRHTREEYFQRQYFLLVYIERRVGNVSERKINTIIIQRVFIIPDRALKISFFPRRIKTFLRVSSSTNGFTTFQMILNHEGTLIT